MLVIYLALAVFSAVIIFLLLHSHSLECRLETARKRSRAIEVAQEQLLREQARARAEMARLWDDSTSIEYEVEL
jgi:hypothetical protein